MTEGAPSGSAAWRALAAAITSITMNGGAIAPRPTFSMARSSVVELDLRRLDRGLRVGAVDRRDAWRRLRSTFHQPSLIGIRQRGSVDLVADAGRRADAEVALGD